MITFLISARSTGALWGFRPRRKEAEYCGVHPRTFAHKESRRATLRGDFRNKGFCLLCAHEITKLLLVFFYISVQPCFFQFLKHCREIFIIIADSPGDGLHLLAFSLALSAATGVSSKAKPIFLLYTASSSKWIKASISSCSNLSADISS